MKSFREYLDIIDGKHPIAESHSKFPEEHSKPMVGMMRYDGLDNSNPYHMWRFLVAVAGHPDPVGEELSIEGPIGNKMASLAYTEVDAEILKAGAAAMGEVGTVISSQDSTEPSFIQTTSPVTAFKGYPR
jgi:hypothetical protein